MAAAVRPVGFPGHAQEAAGGRRPRRRARARAGAGLTSLPFRPVRELALGTAVGVLSGLFGIGGGALAVPGLLWLGLPRHAAHATSLAAIVLTAAAAVVPFSLEGAVHLLAAAALVAGSLAGVSGAAGLLHRVPENGLRIAFLVFMLVVAARMLVGVDIDSDGHVPAMGAAHVAALAVVGVATGALSALLGVGGGLILVPALVLGFGFSQHAAEGTSLAVIVPTALLGAIRHTRRGYTRWRPGLTLGVGGIVGGLGGAGLALTLEGLLLQRLFAAFLVVMGVHLVLRRRGADSG